MNKNTIARYAIGFFFIVGVLAIFYLGVLSGQTQQKDVLSMQDFGFYWSCMDGCSNMQELVYGRDIYENESMKLLHHVCSYLCCEQYMQPCDALGESILEELKVE